MQDGLERTLSSWDGKATAPLEQAYETYRNEPHFLEHLVDLCEAPTCQRGATWLLKHHFDRKGQLSDELAARHLTAIPLFDHWEAKLHFLQCFEHLRISEDAKVPLNRFIESEVTSANKFVRAWACYALAIFALRFPEHKEHALDTLKQAGNRETAGSVKVRIRKALEKLDK